MLGPAEVAVVADGELPADLITVNIPPSRSGRMVWPVIIGSVFSGSGICISAMSAMPPSPMLWGAIDAYETLGGTRSLDSFVARV